VFGLGRLTDVKTLTGPLAVALVLLLAPPATSAQAALPVGEADGVRVVREHGGVVVVFTAKAAKLYKRIAGKPVQVSCTEITRGGSNSGRVGLRAPARRGKLVTGDKTRGLDYCRVWLAPHTITRRGERTRVGRLLIVSVPLTQRGAVFLDEEKKVTELVGVLAVAAIVKERQKLPGYPTHAQLIQRFPKAADEVVALAAPGDAPPPKKVGYFSDGQEHIAAVTLSSSGRRLFIETGADDFLGTNVAEYLFGDRP
jgi:hypothetical protein